MAHQALTDQEGVDAGLPQTGDVGGGENPALADDDTVLRHQRREPLGRRKRRLEGLEVAIVDADEAAVELERALQLGVVVHLGDGIHAPVLGGSGEVAGRGVADLSQNDEDAVGTPGPRFHHLVGVEHEVLAQRGQRGGGARGREILRRALEGGPVGQHGEAGSAARLIGFGQSGRIEVGADQTL